MTPYDSMYNWWKEWILVGKAAWTNRDNRRIKIKIGLGLTGGNSGGGVLVPCLDFKYEIKERILLIIKLINHL